MAFSSAVALVKPEQCEAAIRWTEARCSGWERLLDTGESYSPWRVRIDADGMSGPESGPDILDDPEISWLPRKLVEVGSSLNRQIWRYDITGWNKARIIRYVVGHELRQHIDLNENACNFKLVMLLQLSPPENYEGGVLEFGCLPETAPREQGTLSAFPAWMPHRVTPITAGIRYVAAIRALGPSFR